MRIGLMDRRITIQRPIEVSDEYGPQPIPDWENVFVRLPAEVKHDLPSRNESVQNGLRMANLPARVRIKYVRGVTSDMRVIVHDETDEVFQISGGPAEIGRREWLEFTITGYST